MPTNKQLREALAKVDAWNKAHPIGTKVIRTDDVGKEHRTKTRSEAWVIPSGMPLVKVDDIAGGYLLDRIRPVDDA